MKFCSFAFEACCKTESLAKEDSMQNLRLNYYIEAETYTGIKKFSRVWFSINDNARPHYINRTVTLDSTKLVHCQKEVVYLKVKLNHNIFYVISVIFIFLIHSCIIQHEVSIVALLSIFNNYIPI